MAYGTTPGQQADGSTGKVIGSMLDSLLASYGVRPDQSAVLDTVEATLDKLGHRAEIVSLRYGKLVVDCDARTASMLAWDEDVLTDTVNARHHGAIGSVEITVRGARSRGRTGQQR